MQKQPQTNKRLIWAQQIRTKSRNRIKQQIRINSSIRERIGELMGMGTGRNGCQGEGDGEYEYEGGKGRERGWDGPGQYKFGVDVGRVYGMMTQSKEIEYNAAQVIGQYLQQEKPQLHITTRSQNLSWAYILSSIMQHNQNYMPLIINTYFPAILHFCIYEQPHSTNNYDLWRDINGDNNNTNTYMKWNVQEKMPNLRRANLEVAYVVLCTLLNIIELRMKQDHNNISSHSTTKPTSQHPHNLQQIQQHLKPLLQNVLQIQSFLHNSGAISIKTGSGSNQLKFYNRLLRLYPEYLPRLQSEGYFIEYLMSVLEENTFQAPIADQVIRILIVITYYDSSPLQPLQPPTPTQTLLTHQILPKLKFLLEFIESKSPKTRSLLCHALTLLENVVFNVGVRQVLECGLLGVVYGMFCREGEGEGYGGYGWRDGDRDGVFLGFDGVVKCACLCYLAIVENMVGDDQDIQIIRNSSIIKKILKILQNYGKHQKQLRIKASQALQNLLNIGTQILQTQQLHSDRPNNQIPSNTPTNPYVYSIRYANGVELLALYEEFEGMLERFGIAGQ